MSNWLRSFIPTLSSLFMMTNSFPSCAQNLAQACLMPSRLTSDVSIVSMLVILGIFFNPPTGSEAHLVTARNRHFLAHPFLSRNKLYLPEVLLKGSCTQCACIWSWIYSAGWRQSTCLDIPLYHPFVPTPPQIFWSVLRWTPVTFSWDKEIEIACLQWHRWLLVTATNVFLTNITIKSENKDLFIFSTIWNRRY